MENLKPQMLTKQTSYGGRLALSPCISRYREVMASDWTVGGLSLITSGGLGRRSEEGCGDEAKGVGQEPLTGWEGAGKE